MPTLELLKEQAMLLKEADRELLAMILLHSLSNDAEDDEDEFELAKRRDAEMDANPDLCMTWDELAATVGRR